MSLQALEHRVRQDLERIDHPNMPWLEPRPAPDGTQALDVLIVGGGQSGTAIAFALKRAKVENILVLDQAPRGQEGPWRTYARMHTLRSPKDYTGPDLDIPSLTYRSWHEARFGLESWAKLGLIPRENWADYLLWIRGVTGVPVRNQARVTHIAPSTPGLLAVTIEEPGRTHTLHCRKLVLATGQDGAGRWWMPDDIAALPTHLRAHAADPVDFHALRNKTVAVLGAGASALDNAATALEAGAAAVHLFCRRDRPQLVQPYRWLTFAGFLRHLSDLDDAWRWRFMSHILGLREGFPQPTWDRAARWPNFHLHTGAPWSQVRATNDQVQAQTPQGPVTADFVIAGTGMDVDFAHRPELAHFAHNIARWSDRYTPPELLRNDRLARYPYLAPDFSLTERLQGTTPELADIHLFSIASTMSFGPSGSSINAMTTAVPKLVAGLTRGLFTADLDRHWSALAAYDVEQSVLSTPATPAPPAPTPNQEAPMPTLTRRTALATATATAAALSAPAIVRAQTRPPAKEWVIGAPLPITGGLAPDGAKQQRGYQFWADTVNATGGLTIGGQTVTPRLVFADYQSNTPRAVQAADRLITQDKCTALFGPLGSGATKATSSVAERYKIPLIAASASSVEVYDQGYRYLFGTFTPNATLTTPLVEIVRSQAPDVDSIAILARNDLFPLAIAQEMEKVAKARGVTVTSFDKYAIGAMDHASALSGIAAAAPKWIFATGYINDLLLIRRQMAELKITAPVITMLAGPAYREFRDELGPLAENVTTASWWAPAAGYTACRGPWPTTDAFVAAYQAKLGVIPDYGEASAVACGVAVQLAAEAAGTTDPVALRDALAALDAPTFFGPLKFGPEGQETALKPPVLQIQDGKLVVLYPDEIKQAKFRRA